MPMPRYIERPIFEPTEDKLAKYHGEFYRLQTEITKRLKPDQRVVVCTNDSNDPVEEYHLTVDKKGTWVLGLGKVTTRARWLLGIWGGETTRVLNDRFTKKAYLRHLLEEYAFIQNSQSFSKMFNDKIGPDEYFAKKDELRKSVKDNPDPFAEGFLGHMENALEQLPKKENAT